MSETKDTKKSQLLLLKNSFNKDFKFTNKEISQNIHWLRQIVSVLIGIIVGAIPITGYPGFIAYILFTCGFVAIYYTKVLEVEEDDFKWELMQEGFMPSLTIFVISWILVYNFLHV
ncbi:hypothetical protein RB653_008768 [Dictyostelium firmibasis]|uniref:Rab5-interacting protein n=1 Tax=Dictyostelium firmibasis TaxID=79012 RepID=A0AAN7TT96_9MYCE